MGRKDTLRIPYFRDSSLRGPGHPRVSKRNLSCEKRGISKKQRENTQGPGHWSGKGRFPSLLQMPYLRIILSKNSEGSAGSSAQEPALHVERTQTPNGQKGADF